MTYDERRGCPAVDTVWSNRWLGGCSPISLPVVGHHVTSSNSVAPPQMNKRDSLVTAQKWAFGDRSAIVVRGVSVDHDSFGEQDIGLPPCPAVLGTVPPWQVQSTEVDLHGPLVLKPFLVLSKAGCKRLAGSLASLQQ